MDYGDYGWTLFCCSDERLSWGIISRAGKGDVYKFRRILVVYYVRSLIDGGDAVVLLGTGKLFEPGRSRRKYIGSGPSG